MSGLGMMQFVFYSNIIKKCVNCRMVLFDFIVFFVLLMVVISGKRYKEIMNCNIIIC